MSKKNDILQKANDLVKEFQVKMTKLLAGTEHDNLLLRFNHVTKTFREGIGHLGNIDLGSTDPIEQEPLTEVMGIDVTRPVQKGLPNVNQAEVNTFQLEVNRVYDGFEERSNKDILDSLDHLTIRGVARKAGLEVTETEPETITSPFITKIKEGIKLKADQELLTAKAKHEAGLAKHLEETGTGPKNFETPGGLDGQSLEDIRKANPSPDDLVNPDADAELNDTGVDAEPNEVSAPAYIPDDAEPASKAKK